MTHLLKYEQTAHLPNRQVQLMASLEQIQQDLQILPQEALNLVYQFIQLLKKSSQPSQIIQTSQPSSAPTTSAPDAADWSDLIGCASAEEDLSVHYKTDEHKPQLFQELTRLNLQLSETAYDTPLTSLIGAAPGNFATPAAADQFIRQERDEWDC